MSTSAHPNSNVIDLTLFRDARQLRDQRMESRLLTHERMFIQVVESTDPSNVGITLICRGLDTSAHGMRIVTDKPLPAGCLVDIWVEVSPRKRKLFLSGHVRWNTPTRAEVPQYEIGVSLHSGHATDITTWRKLKYV